MEDDYYYLDPGNYLSELSSVDVIITPDLTTILLLSLVGVVFLWCSMYAFERFKEKNRA